MEERGIPQLYSSLKKKKTPSRAKRSDCSLPCFKISRGSSWNVVPLSNAKRKGREHHTSPEAVPEQQGSDWSCSSNYRPWNNGPKSLGFALLNRSILSCMKLLP